RGQARAGPLARSGGLLLLRLLLARLEPVEQARPTAGDLLVELADARLGALDVALEELAALGMRLRLLEEDLRDRFVGEDAGETLRVKDRVDEDALWNPVL